MLKLIAFANRQLDAAPVPAMRDLPDNPQVSSVANRICRRLDRLLRLRGALAAGHSLYADSAESHTLGRLNHETIEDAREK